MVFLTASTERLRISSTGQSTFSIPRTSGANVNILTLSDNVTGIQTPGFGTRIQYLSNGTGVQAAIGLENGGTGTNNESQISFYTQNAAGGLTQRVIVASNGYLRLTGAGIQFNGDTAAANALDDYEEGTVDITTLTDGSATLTQFVDNRTLSYTKIGNRVYVNGNIYNQSISGTWSNPLRIPLPFTASSGDGRNRSYGAAALYNWGSASDNIYLIEAGGTYASLVSAGSGGSWGTITTSAGFTAVVNFFYITS
jgi:hypothetical protein